MEEIHYCAKYGCREGCSTFLGHIFPSQCSLCQWYHPGRQALHYHWHTWSPIKSCYLALVCHYNYLCWCQIRHLMFLENSRSQCQLPNPSGFQEQDPKEHYGVRSFRVCTTSTSNTRLVKSSFWQLAETQLKEIPKNSRAIVLQLLPACVLYSSTE